MDLGATNPTIHPRTPDDHLSGLTTEPSECAFGSAGADDGSTQYDVEAAAVDGGIHHVVVSNGGAGYTNGTYNNVPVTGFHFLVIIDTTLPVGCFNIFNAS